MLRRLGLVTLLVLLALASPAYADTWSSPDPVGDSTTVEFSPDPEPCGTVTETPTTEGDIRRISVRHSRERIVLTLQVSGLVRASRTSAFFELVTPARAWNVDVSRWDGSTEVTYYRAPQIDEDDVNECGLYGYGVMPRTCRGAVGRIDVQAGLITASLPRRCFGTPRWVQAGGQVFGGRGTRTFSDVWVPRGFDGTFFEPAVGRRVYAGPRR